MSTLTLPGATAIGNGTIDLDTNTLKAMAIDASIADTAIKAISGATNATPIVITATSHGFSNGDYVYIDKVAGNLAANGLWKIANTTTNTFELQRPDGVNAVGSAAYTSGGFAINLGPSAAANFLDDYSAARVGTDQTLTSVTFTDGVLDAADPTWASVAGGSTVDGAILYKSVGSDATDVPFYLLTHKSIVTVNTQAAASATSILVEPLADDIASGTVLTFSNGASATLSGAATAGDRSLAVNALAAIVTAGSRALAPRPNSNFPLTTNGGSFSVTFPNGGTKIVSIIRL